MFEQEIEMEQRNSSIIPLVLILGLAGVIVGSIVYWVLEMRKSLTPEQATVAVSEILKTQGPVTLLFHTGSIEPSINERPRDPHYKLLAKAGLVTVNEVKGKDRVNVTLTPDGERMITSIPEFKKTENKDGTLTYFVPLASKQLVSITTVKMSGPNVAHVEYTWKWAPTPMGEIFDADSKYVKNFNIWDTQTLISKYDVNYYQGEPAKAAINMIRGDKGKWNPATE